jgi:hypothetical protein
MIDWKDLPSVVERFRRFRDAASPEERPYADLILGALEWVDPETFAARDDPEQAIMNAVLEFPRRDDRGRALARALPPDPERETGAGEGARGALA